MKQEQWEIPGDSQDLKLQPLMDLLTKVILTGLYSGSTDATYYKLQKDLEGKDKRVSLLKQNLKAKDAALEKNFVNKTKNKK